LLKLKNGMQFFKEKLCNPQYNVKNFRALRAHAPAVYL
jgi:hypothetical protein